MKSLPYVSLLGPGKPGSWIASPLAARAFDVLGVVGACYNPEFIALGTR